MSVCVRSLGSTLFWNRWFLLPISERCFYVLGFGVWVWRTHEKFLVTYRDSESATKFVDAFNMNMTKRRNRTRTEAPKDYQRPAAAALTGELHSEEDRLVNLCSGSHSTSVLIARMQKYGELEYYNEAPPNAFACYFNPEDAAKAAAAECGRPLGARLKYGRPVPGAICGSCFRVVCAQPKSYTSHRSLCTGPPKEPATPTPRPAAPANTRQPTPSATMQSARAQTPSQRPSAFELPDLSKVKIEEGHSNLRVLHIYTAEESIDYLVSRFEAYGTLEYLLVHDVYATVSYIKEDSAQEAYKKENRRPHLAQIESGRYYPARRCDICKEWVNAMPREFDSHTTLCSSRAPLALTNATVAPAPEQQTTGRSLGAIKKEAPTTSQRSRRGRSRAPSKGPNPVTPASTDNTGFRGRSEARHITPHPTPTSSFQPNEDGNIIIWQREEEDRWTTMYQRPDGRIYIETIPKHPRRPLWREIEKHKIPDTTSY